MQTAFDLLVYYYNLVVRSFRIAYIIIHLILTTCLADLLFPRSAQLGCTSPLQFFDVQNLISRAVKMYHIVYDVFLNLTGVVQTYSDFTPSKTRQIFNSVTVNRNNQPSNLIRNNRLLLLKDLLIVFSQN